MKKFLSVVITILVLIATITIIGDIKGNKKLKENAIASTVEETHLSTTSTIRWYNEVETSTTSTTISTTMFENEVETKEAKANVEYVTEPITTARKRVTTTARTVPSTTKTPKTKKVTNNAATQATFKSTTKSTAKSTTKITNKATTKSTTQTTTKVDWRGKILSSENSPIQGPSGKEIYYNIPMDNVIETAKKELGDNKYWIRKDGVKMYGNYVICASDPSYYQYGAIIETSLGTGIILDKCYQYGTIKIATNW